MNDITNTALNHLIDPDGRFLDVIAPVVDDLGYRLIRVAFGGTDPKRGAILVVAVEPKDGSKLKVDDCKIISQTISASMDVADPISDSYVLEVGSAGLNRHLSDTRDFERFKSFEGKFECKRPDDNGQRKFRGFIEETNADGVTIKTQERGLVLLEWQNLSMARLVGSDELLKALQDGTV